MLYGAILATAFAAAALPAWSETNNPPEPSIPNRSSQQAAPPQGVSKPGTPGLPGSKSGPAPAITVGEGAATRKPGGLEPEVPANATGSATSEVTKQQDVSGVPG